MTSPEHEVVSDPGFTVGQWVKGAPSSGPTTKPIYIAEGDTPLGFTVPVRLPVLDPEYTVPLIEVEGVVVLGDPWDDTEIWLDTKTWLDDGKELVTYEGQGVAFEGEVVIY